MKLKWLFPLPLLLASWSVQAQTTVTLAVTDAGSQTWNNGTWSVTLQATPGSPPPGQQYSVVSGGGSIAPQQGSLSGSGTATISLPPNGKITPQPSQWFFNVCPQATSVCYIQSVTIVGSTQTVTLIPPAISVRGSSSPPSAYTDAEISGPTIGFTYYNLTDATLRVCTVAIPCTWVSVSGGGGTPGGSNTQVQYNNNGAFGGITGATTDGTNLLVTTQPANDKSTKAASTEYADAEPGTGANKALSNLASVAVSQALTPGTDNSISLDSLTNRYINVWLSGVLGWTNGSGSADTGLSRDSAAVVDVGNGSAGDTSGTLQATALKTTGSNGGVGGAEGTCANVAPASGSDFICPNSTAHAMEISNNDGSYEPAVSRIDLGTITYNASGTTTFAAASNLDAAGAITATHSTSTTFSPTNLVKWGSYVAEIFQDGTGGGTTFTLGTGGSCSAWKVATGSGYTGSTVTLASAASALNILAFTFDGTNCVATFQ